MTNDQPNQPLDADAIRRAHLEEHIPEILELIKEYEEIIRLSDEPKEVERCKKKLPDLRQQLVDYQREYAELTGQGASPAGQPAALVPFSDDWIARLAHPVAAPCAALNQAGDATARFLALDNLLLSTVKYLAAIALAQYRKESPRSDRLRPWLGRLSRHHLSEWSALLDEIDAHYSQDMAARPTIAAILFDAYRRPLVDDTGMAHAYRELGERLRSEAGGGSPTVAHFVGRLVAYRERTWEAGAAHLPPGFAEALIPLLHPALRELLDALSLVRDYPLRYAKWPRQTKEDWGYEMVDWAGPGEEGTRGEDLCVEGTGPQPPYTPRRLYLCTPDGRPLLNLHPLIIHHKDHLYFLESFGEDEELAFLPCCGGAILNIPEKLRSSLLSIYKPLEGDEDAGAVMDRIEEQVEQMEQPEPPPIPRIDEPSLADLLPHLSTEGRQALEIGLGESLRIGRFWLGVEFLLMGLSKQDGRPLSDLFREWRASRGHFRGALRGMVGVAPQKKEDWRRMDAAELGAQAFDRLQPADPATLAAGFLAKEEHPPVITPRMMQVLRDAANLAGEEQIGHAHLLLAALKHPHCLPVNLLLGLTVQAGWDPREVPAWVAQQAGAEPLDLDQEAESPPDGGPPVRLVRPDGTEPPALKVRGVLARYGRDLTGLAQRSDLRAAIGDSAHKAMVQMGLILQQTQANNPILLGDSGVGKTAIVEGFAWRLATDPKVVPQLAGKRIVDLPPTALLAGTRYRGDLEERLQKLVDEVRGASGSTIVFIDEIHTILGGRAEGGLGAIADGLKPALARGEFPCIGATTVGEYRRHIEADPALARRFTPVWIEEPKTEEAIEIVGQVAQEHLGPDHGVTYSQAVIKEAVRLSVRYIHDEFLPGKAIKLLDQAGPRVLMGGSLSGRDEVDQDQPVGGVVTVEIVREIVSERTGVPLTRLSEDESKKLIGLEKRLKERVKGQDEAVTQVARVVKRARAGLADPRRPPGVFLFAGPTGVGKTELGLALAEALFDEEDAILRIDMSEYMEKHQISRLIGSPPGYVGYHEEGQLTGRLRRRPYSVVLLDEIEKAHDDVQHLFLQLFDAGRLTDARGNLADGRNAIFVMTTNLGAKEALGFIGQRQPYQQRLREAIEKHFSLEFLNRIDRIIYFEPLTSDLLLEIFDKLFKPVAERFRAQGILVEVTEPFKRALCQRHADEKRGARPLERAIEDEIVAPLTDKLLAGEIGPGMKVVVGEGAEWEVSDAPQPLDPTDPDARDELKAQNEAIFDREFDALAARLREREIEIEIDAPTREFLCDPFWIQTTLDQALVKLVEEPLLEQLEAGELQPGDRVRVKRYASNLEFKKVEGDE